MAMDMLLPPTATPKPNTISRMFSPLPLPLVESAFLGGGCSETQWTLRSLCRVRLPPPPFH